MLRYEASVLSVTDASYLSMTSKTEASANFKRISLQSRLGGLATAAI
ncbi:hypothetical protein OQX63_20740 [Pedobacter sp. PF22-3]|nr:hypothetical protein [Pedobacter sp. PF22-3]MCX2495935.1 hypothetical protein [Pedobacter sp. PF22-3]